jgi:hypothetical protein
MKDKVESIAEWQALPLPALPSLKNAGEKGIVYRVFKVGFLAVDLEDCEQSGVKCQMSQTDKGLLPTAVLEFAGEKQLCRMPLELTHWAVTAVQMAGSGVTVFPTEVEFGILNGRTYAEIL